MNRRTLGMLTLAGAVLLATTATVQLTSAAGQTPRPRLSPAVRGAAKIAYTQPAAKNATIEGRAFIVTTFQVKNLESAAIAGFRAQEFWYDSAGDPVSGDDFRQRSPIQPGEIITVTLESPRNPRMSRNQYQFSHANGEIEPELTDNIED